MTRPFSEIYAAAVAERGLTPDPAQQSVLPEFDRLAAKLAEPLPRRGFFNRKAPPPAITGLYLWGGVGRGKSMLMDLFFEHAPVEAKRRVHFHAFMQEVHRGIAAARKRGVDDAVAPVAAEMAQGTRLLCFDEMQISDITDAMIVGRLFEKLLGAGLAIVTTSNRVPDDLYKNGLNRQLFLPFIELLKERMVVHHLDAEQDYRGGRDAGEARYFTPAGAEARAAMDALWDRLTDGAEGQAGELAVGGRQVPLPRVAGRVVRAGFWDLCGRQLGAADYLALAERAEWLLLDDVPCLGSENYNEARRFVTLVDALYEAKTGLAMSAEAAPENLYVEGEGLFEFARTASRLEEMQSADWRRIGAGGDGA